MKIFTRLLGWAQKNERHLGAVLFVFGFVTDLFTFSLLPVSIVNLAFVGYLTLATVSTLGSHLFSEAREHPTLWRRILSIVFPLLAQYSIGSLLSGCLIFYTKSSAILVSWPFLLLLIAVFLGNEYFRTYYKHLAFQVVLLFFAIYAYLIFALPLLLHKLGPWIFAGSTALSVVALGIFLYVLSKVRTEGFRRSLKYILPGSISILVVMNTFYFTGVIPPIPLTLPTAGIYHSVTHRADSYVVTAENVQSWWDLRGTVVHHVPGTPLFAFSSVSAPFKFASYVVHVWQRYDETNNKWVESSRVTFPMIGGRDGGFRGYSEVTSVDPGKWRVTIETPDGQVIGRLSFRVETAQSEPLVTEIAK